MTGNRAPGRSWIALAILAFCAAPQAARASTQCTVYLNSIWSGDDGYIWLNFTNGGSAYLSPNDPDKQATLAMGMTALTGGRKLVVRYGADSVDCAAAARSDLIGLYLF